ncbi:MAG TPA: TetR/AcrR family transcriptional regulator [Dongiaceae bacterium]|nr:TetR/AcrR family transcriptional regulator [Dongiaceae bacterium]
MKTRDRILVTSLELFNLCGEPNVTTIDIANEMDISPGNLYYHFRNKDEIIAELFQQFEASMHEVLQSPQEEGLEMMDYWMYIHLIFERVWEYRFLYRDLATILERNEKLQKRFNRILDKKAANCRLIMSAMRDSGIILQISDKQIEALATNVVITGTYWMNYQQVRNLGDNPELEDLGRGVYQVMSLIVPYLPPEGQEALEAVAATYLE